MPRFDGGIDGSPLGEWIHMQGSMRRCFVTYDGTLADLLRAQQACEQELQAATGMFDLQYGTCPPLCTDEPYVSKLRKCPKCGRSKQTPKRKTCDGCGAPK